ncbi:frizzled-2-like isoform X2 [Homarus americanus]|uniref:frizzled-2-like isoform X2 n=1 Tax=Homarus americanus TaxID=6706 RepID=UPI001C49666E|nr:frizzled-2-like isoform X2 [Homarus americanus]
MRPKMTGSRPSLLLTAWLLATTTGAGPTDFPDSRPCEALQEGMCQGLGYEATFFPNLLNHKSQDLASAELLSFLPLIEVECSEVLREFLCTLYMPVCTNYGFHLPPCRSLCKQAREGCEGVMTDMGLTWPSKFDCTRFPEHHELMCLLTLNHTGTVPSTTTTLPPPTRPPSGRWGSHPTHSVGPQLTQCVSNADCIFERSVCRGGECVCEYPRTWGPSGCEETQILGGQCTSDNQCTAVTPNAECNDSVCTCVSPLTNYFNLACIHASVVGAMCYNDAQCRAVNKFSFCRFVVSEVVGTCTCDPDQFIDTHGRCVPRLGKDETNEA